MMRIQIGLVLLWATVFFQPLAVYAVSLSVRGEAGDTILHTNRDRGNSATVGNFTIAVFQEAVAVGKLKFEGDEDSIVSINGITNDMRSPAPGILRAYGWCFSLDGVVPATMPGDTKLESNAAKIEWFYGYMVFQDNIWSEVCVPGWE